MIAWPLAALVLDQLGARRRPPRRRFDAIVVAGSDLEPDGTPGMALRARTRVAVDLWRAGAAPLVFFTGGARRGTTEARSALAWAQQRLGLSANAAGFEEQSTSTEENACFSARALGRDAAVLVVTDTYHLVRTIDAFRHYYDAVDGVASCSPLHARCYGAMREVVAVAHYLTVGKLRRAELARRMSTGVHASRSQSRPSRRERWLFTVD